MPSPTKPDRIIPGLFTERELYALRMALARSQEPFSEAAMDTVLLWAAEMRVGAAMVEMAMQGRIALVVQDGAVRGGKNRP